ncbi:M1 family aminopeptidase [Emticicia oligotrophica]|nr:M1 family aminopeptidase [Emticicia oligotrophica]
MRFFLSFVFFGWCISVFAQENTIVAPTKGQYNPSRTKEVDLVHTKLELKPDWKNQWLLGKATITLKPHFYPQTQVSLDAKGFEIKEVTQNNKPLKFEYNKLVLKVDLAQVYTRKDTFSLQITYIAKPNELPTGGSDAITSDKGLYFINPLGTELDKPQQIWTQGETEANSCWFPTIDSPNQKMTQDIFLTVESKFTTLSNGKLISSKLNSDGTRTDYWKQSKPAAPYLTMIAVGDFKKIIDPNFKDFEVSYFVEPKFEKYAMNIFGRTPEMIRYFEKLLGVKFQWEKYAQMAVRDYVSGAMENTTATIHGEFIQKDNHQLVDDNDDGVIAHELFHHWFGDLVTCESWANLPLNEAFANYAEYLWANYKYGKDEGDLVSFIALNQYLDESKEKQEPLIRFQYNDKEDMFDSHSYAKGGRILHMLRNVVGDEAFFEALKQYLLQYSYKTAEIEDLRIVFENVTGQDLHWFFEQWFLKPGHPILKVSHDYKEGKILLNIKQIQDTTYTPIYRIPLKVFVKTEGEEFVKEIVIDKKQQSFEIAASFSPKMVLLDPENILVGKIEHPKSKDELIYQFYNSANIITKLNVLDSLTFIPEEDTTFYYPAADKKIRQLLIDATKDKFWRVRQFAVQKLFDYDGEDFLEVERALQYRVIHDERSYVRADAILAMKGFQNSHNDKLFREALNDSSYTVQAAAIEALLATKPVDALELVLKFETSTDPNIFAAVANYFAEEASPLRFDWFMIHLKQMKGNDLYQVLGIFGTYLVKSSTEIQLKSVPLLKQIAQNDSQWYVRFAGMQTLNLISDNKEVKVIIKEITDAEKDERLKKIYKQFKDI